MKTALAGTVLKPEVANTLFWFALLPLFGLSLIPSAILFLRVEKPFSLQPFARKPRISSAAPAGYGRAQ